MSNTTGTAQFGNFTMTAVQIAGDTRVRYTIKHSSGTTKMDMASQPQDITTLLQAVVGRIATSDPRKTIPADVQKKCPKMLERDLPVYLDAQAAVSA